KLSKSKKNFTPPDEVFETYGADALRYFLLSSAQIGEDYIFSKDRVKEYFKRDILTLWNCYKFFNIYVDKDFENPELELESKLDKWILSRLNTLVKDVEKWMNDYHLTEAARQFQGFIDDFSNWYIRRSRKKLQKPKNDKEKERTAKIYYHILLTLSKTIAPFLPFLSEDLYQKLNGPKESVHLEDYPKAKEELIDSELEDKMKKVREAAKKALSIRSNKGIKVRQPLSAGEISKKSILKNEKELLEILKNEINVNEVKFDSSLDKGEIKLDTEITTELKQKGTAREIIRKIQRMRKKAGYQPQDKVLIRYEGDKEIEKALTNFSDYIKKEGRIEDFSLRKEDMDFDMEKDFEMKGKKLWIGIKKK
ncbi:MAG: class I tRNA ligase family protein, partial [Minisyncoccales bacterium]